MQKLRFVNGNGVELDLTDNVKYGVVDWNGFSECGNEIQSQTVPFSDGSVFLDTLLSERELSITIAISDGGDLSKRYEYKRELIKAFNPKLGEGYLYYKNDFLEKRIKVVPSLPIFPTKNSDNGGTLKAELSLTACNPYFEDVEETTIYSEKDYQNDVFFAEVESNGDVNIPFDLLINKEKHEENEIKIFEKVNDTYLLNDTINHKMEDLSVLLSTQTGNKKIFSKKLKKINYNFLNKNVVYAWGYLIAISSNTIEYSDDFFKTHKTLHISNFGGTNPVYSKNHDCIYLHRNVGWFDIGTILRLNRDFTVEDTELECGYSFFGLTENEDETIICYSKGQISQEKLSIAVFDKNRTLIQRTDFNQSVISPCYTSNIYVGNAGRAFAINNLSGQIILRKDADQYYIGSSQETSRSMFWTRHKSTQFTNYDECYFMSNGSNNKLYGLSYNYNTNALMNEEIETFELGYRGGFDISGTDYMVKTTGELVTGIERYYIQDLEDFNNPLDCYYKLIDYNHDLILIIQNNSSPSYCNVYHAENKENLINEVQRLNYEIRINGTKIESKEPFILYYRNKYVGV